VCGVNFTPRQILRHGRQLNACPVSQISDSVLASHHSAAIFPPLQRKEEEEGIKLYPKSNQSGNGLGQDVYSNQRSTLSRREQRAGI